MGTKKTELINREEYKQQQSTSKQSANQSDVHTHTIYINNDICQK